MKVFETIGDFFRDIPWIFREVWYPEILEILRLISLKNSQDVLYHFLEKIFSSFPFSLFNLLARMTVLIDAAEFLSGPESCEASNEIFW